MNISELIDEIVRVKAERESLNTISSELTSKLVRLEKDLMEAMASAGTTKAASAAGHSCKMEEKVYPAIKDWTAFYDYVTRTNSFDLLHKRLSNTAFRDRWAAGEEIPGTSSSSIWEVSITKSRS
jgi:hypothetical protein